MNIIEAHEKHLQGHKIIREVSEGLVAPIVREYADAFAFGLKSTDILTTNWQIEQPPMDFSEAMKHFLTGKTVSCKELPQFRYNIKAFGRKDVYGFTFLKEEIASKSWFIVEEKPQQNNQTQ